MIDWLIHRSAHIFCKGLKSKYFRLYTQLLLCHRGGKAAETIVSQ